MSLLDRIYTLVRGCQHPAHLLAVAKDATTEMLDEDFIKIDYHLFCRGCGERVTIKYAKLNGGVDGFLSRGK